MLLNHYVWHRFLKAVALVVEVLYDSIQRHLAIEKLVTRPGPNGQEKKYYRFRPARWYGGIVTADCAGCGLLCKFCWVRDSVMLRPADTGSFYAPEQVAGSLTSLARKCGFKQLRVSGGEPTLGKAHLLQLLDLLEDEGLLFILETNGILLGRDEEYAKDLARHDFIHARVSVKGCNKQEFSALTGAKPEGFELQLSSLKYLTEAGVECHPSVMVSFSNSQSLRELKEKLRQVGSDLAEHIEIEELILYPHVVKRIQKYGLHHVSGYEPSKVPKEQV
jgi:uncharacterized Fe-S cluster-containing radical SAM superfamily protein